MSALFLHHRTSLPKLATGVSVRLNLEGDFMRHPNENYSRSARHGRIFSAIAPPILLLLALAVTGFAQEKAPALHPNQAIERQMRGGEIHEFQVRLQAGEYLRVAVMQQGIDIQLNLLDSSGQKLVETDGLNGSQGLEIAAIIAMQNSSIRVEVTADKAVPSGQYVLKIEALRPATESDRHWVTAQKLYQEGILIRAQPGTENQEQAVRKFADALRIWQVIDDPLMVAHAVLSGRRIQTIGTNAARPRLLQLFDRTSARQAGMAGNARRAERTGQCDDRIG